MNARSLVCSSAVIVALVACREPAQTPTNGTVVARAPVEPPPSRDRGTHNQDASENTDRIGEAPRGVDAIAGLRCSLSRQGRLSPVGEFGAEDVNDDRVLDLVERVPAVYAQSAGGLLIASTARRVSLPWPRIARGERCVIDDPDARAYARRMCPSRPLTYFARRPGAQPSVEDSQAEALRTVACARAWGVEVTAIVRSLDAIRRAGALPEGVQFDALAAFARQLNPPWILSNASTR
ncbi:MAG: hypothetical protein U0269_10090 [Polyangiales bacterium]